MIMKKLKDNDIFLPQEYRWYTPAFVLKQCFFTKSV